MNFFLFSLHVKNLSYWTGNKLHSYCIFFQKICTVINDRSPPKTRMILHKKLVSTLNHSFKCTIQLIKFQFMKNSSCKHYLISVKFSITLQNHTFFKRLTIGNVTTKKQNIYNWLVIETRPRAKKKNSIAPHHDIKTSFTSLHDSLSNLVTIIPTKAEKM